MILNGIYRLLEHRSNSVLDRLAAWDWFNGGAIVKGNPTYQNVLLRGCRPTIAPSHKGDRKCPPCRNKTPSGQGYFWGFLVQSRTQDAS